MSTDDKQPVLIVTDKRGRLIHAGNPDTFNTKTLAGYAKEGHKISTITIKQFRAKEWKWYWES